MAEILIGGELVVWKAGDWPIACDRCWPLSNHLHLLSEVGPQDGHDLRLQQAARKKQTSARDHTGPGAECFAPNLARVVSERPL